MTRPVMNLKSTLERIAWQGAGYLPPAYERDDPEQWQRRWREESARLADLLDLEFMRVEDARAAGWEDYAGREPRDLAVRLPDGRTCVVDHRLKAPKEHWMPVHDHVADYLLGRVAGRAAPEAPRLPDLPRAVLANDGLDPTACERLGLLLGRIALTIHGRHHGATRALSPHAADAHYAVQQTGQYPPVDPAGCRWSQIKFVVSKNPQVHVVDDKVTARVELPATVKSALVGRPLTAVFEHPTFQGLRITRATVRPTGMTLKVE